MANVSGDRFCCEIIGLGVSDLSWYILSVDCFITDYVLKFHTKLSFIIRFLEVIISTFTSVSIKLQLFFVRSKISSIFHHDLKELEPCPTRVRGIFELKPYLLLNSDLVS